MHARNAAQLGARSHGAAQAFAVQRLAAPSARRALTPPSPWGIPFCAVLSCCRMTVPTPGRWRFVMVALRCSLLTFTAYYLLLTFTAYPLESTCTSAAMGFELPVPGVAGENLDREGCRCPCPSSRRMQSQPLTPEMCRQSRQTGITPAVLVLGLSTLSTVFRGRSGFS